MCDLRPSAYSTCHMHAHGSSFRTVIRSSDSIGIRSTATMAGSRGRSPVRHRQRTGSGRLVVCGGRGSRCRRVAYRCPSRSPSACRAGQAWSSYRHLVAGPGVWESRSADDADRGRAIHEHRGTGVHAPNGRSTTYAVAVPDSVLQTASLGCGGLRSAGSRIDVSAFSGKPSSPVSRGSQ